MRHLLLASAVFLLVVTSIAKAGPIGETPFPASYVPAGNTMYKQFCAACHGAGAKGDGPAASTLKARPSDLTTLAKRHAGKFPYEYVSNILRFGPGPSAHGSSDMPTWGPIFQFIDKNNERAVEQRIRNLNNYLASLQEK